MNLLNRWVLPLLGLLLLAGAASFVADRIRGPSPEELAGELQREGELLRGRIDACFSTRSAIELRFQEHVRKTEALGDSIEGLEALDPRGVPAARYDEYLGLVDRFNQSTERWEGMAEELRSFEPQCRELVEAYNGKADSIRILLTPEGGLELRRLPAASTGEEIPDDDTPP